MFATIAEISPWWWLAFALALGAIEMATMSFFLIWPALAALIMAGVVALGPGWSGEAITAFYAVLAIALTFAGRAVVRRWGDGGGAETSLNSRSAQLVGRKATVLEWVDGHGAVEIDGTRWSAKWIDDARAAPAASVTVTDADGMTLMVRNG